MTDRYRGMRAEVDEVRRALDAMGVEHEDYGEITSFSNGDGECMVSPSAQHDGRLFVSYSASDWCTTAGEALRLCGLRDEEEQ